MKCQEAQATSFSNGNSDWVSGISFFPHGSVYTQEQGPSKVGAELQTLKIFQTQLHNFPRNVIYL